jgi:tetratricopeptide (TPR) repeat protein
MDTRTAMSCSQFCHFPSARLLCEESLAIYQALGDKKNIALCLNNLGLITSTYDREAAKRLFEESLAIRREISDILGIASSLHNLGFLALEEVDYQSARTLYQESLGLSQQLGNEAGIARLHINLADLAHHEGNYTLAQNHYEESIAIWQDLGDRFMTTCATASLGILALDQGEYGRARLLLKESLLVCLELREKGAIHEIIWEIAQWAASQQMIERAGRLWGAFTALCESNGLPPPLEDSDDYRSMDAIRTRSDPILWRKVWDEGHAMSMEQAIEYAADYRFE